MKADILVIGGGPAGMMAAGTASENGADVLLIDKNARLGRKLMITGKGRCNLTNACDPDTYFSNIPRNPLFLQSSVRRFGPQDTMDFFEEKGLRLKVERGRRVFPVSDKASDVVDAMVSFVRRAGVRVKGDSEAVKLLIREGRAAGARLQSGEEISAGRVIVATGGLSYPLTGSTGDGYRFADEAGHTLVETRPSLVPVETRESWCADAQGLSLRNVTLTVTEKESGKRVFCEQGELLFTHYGVSGPLVLSASAHMRKGAGEYLFSIDLKPALEEAVLDSRILRDFAEIKNRDFGNSLGKLLPRKIIPVVIRLCGIPPEKKVHQVTKDERNALVKCVKGLTLTPVKFRPVEEAVVTSGGVSVSEIDPKTMESKIVPGLYFAGEVLDVDGYTGGFNLQIAFSTGRAAGLAASEKEELR